MPRPVEDRSDVGGAAQFTNIGPVPLSRSGPVPLSRSAFPLPSRFPAPIPKDVAVSGYVWEVENQRLRKPNPGSNTGRDAHFLNARKFRRAPSPADALGVAIGDGRSFPPDLARSEGKRGRKKIRGPFVQRFRNLANFVQVSLR